MKIQKIVSGMLNNNTYIVTNEYNEGIIIDAAANVDEIKKVSKNIKFLGLILTHGHFDHIKNLDKIIREFNLKVFIHKNDYDKLFDSVKNCSSIFNENLICNSRDYVFLKDFLNHNFKNVSIQNIESKPENFLKAILNQDIQNIDFNPKKLNAINNNLDPTYFLLDDYENFKIGNFEIKTYSTKGHTNGSICIEIEDILFTGDTLFNGSYGRTDLPTGSIEDMRKSLKFIKDKFSGKTFYSGHGEEGIVKSN